jgi:histidinol-phosphate/aromatic aminotransferase/cobyric acid decarboxylase-like protein
MFRFVTIYTIPGELFLSVGSDEVLDLLIRVFVQPGVGSDGQGQSYNKILITLQCAVCTVSVCGSTMLGW